MKNTKSDLVLSKKELNKIKNVRNREGEIISFDLNKIIDAVSNLCKAFVPKPNSGITPRTKNIINVIAVHFNFSRKERNF